MTLQYVSPAQLNDSISLFEVRAHCMAWFALHSLCTGYSVHLKMCIIRGQLRFERVEVYVERVLL